MSRSYQRPSLRFNITAYSKLQHDSEKQKEFFAAFIRNIDVRREKSAKYSARKHPITKNKHGILMSRLAVSERDASSSIAIYRERDRERICVPVVKLKIAAPDAT